MHLLQGRAYAQLYAAYAARALCPMLPALVSKRLVNTQATVAATALLVRLALTRREHTVLAAHAAVAAA